MLCSKCQDKLDSGAISKAYLDVAKKLISRENYYPFLQNVTLENISETESYLVLIVNKGDLRKFENEPKSTRELGNLFSKRILVLEKGVKDRKFLEDLFAGQHIVTINIIWLPDGTTETRVVLRGRGSRKLSKKRIQDLVEVANEVKNMNLRVEYTF